jgi:DNA-binding response OmpR family regulator
MDIQVIMVTGVKKELDDRVMSSLGVNNYITKPFKPKELLDTIDTL